jgi:hypothetical protein
MTTAAIFQMNETAPNKLNASFMQADAKSFQRPKKERITLKNREAHSSNFSIEDMEDETRIGGKYTTETASDVTGGTNEKRSQSQTNALSFLTPFSPTS